MMCPVEGETAVGAASATPRKEDGVNQGQWAPRGTTGPQGYKDSQDCRAAKVTRGKEALPGSQDQKEMWEQEAFLDSLVPTGFPDILGKGDPEDRLAMMAATERGETPARRDPPVLGASLALLDPKDPKGKKVNLTRCLARTETNTGVNLGSLDWSASRGLPAAPGLWDRWGLLELRGDQDRLDPLDQKDSKATEDLVFMEKRVRRATWASQDPMGFHQTPTMPSSGPRRKCSTQISIRVKKEVRGNQEDKAFP